MAINHKGQTSIFTALFYIIIFFIIFAVALSPIISSTSNIVVNITGLTGIEAFFVANLMLWFIFGFIIMILWMTTR